jgi:hypothetical protein
MTTLPLGDFLMGGDSRNDLDSFVQSPFDSRNPLALTITVPPKNQESSPIIYFFDWTERDEITANFQLPQDAPIKHPYHESADTFLQDYKEVLRVLTLSAGYDWSSRGMVRPKWRLVLCFPAGEFRFQDANTQHTMWYNTATDRGRIVPDGFSVPVPVIDLQSSGSIDALRHSRIGPDVWELTSTITFPTYSSSRLDELLPSTVQNLSAIPSRPNRQVLVAGTSMVNSDFLRQVAGIPGARSGQLYSDVVYDARNDLWLFILRAIAKWQSERNSEPFGTRLNIESVGNQTHAAPFYDGRHRYLAFFASTILAQMT